MWGIRKRRFGRDWKRRMELFDWLVGLIGWCGRLWSGNMGMEKVGSGKIAKKIYEVGVESGWEDTGLYSKGKRQRGENEKKTGRGGLLDMRRSWRMGEAVSGRRNAGRRLRRKGKSGESE